MNYRNESIIKLIYPWNEAIHCPEVTFYPRMTERGFYIKIIVEEQNPKMVMTEHFQPVHLDSCVEWFVNFSPTTSAYYFNFEVNANGVMNVSFRKNRHEVIRMVKQDVEQLKIKAQVEATYWCVEYEVPFSLVKKYYPEFKCENEIEVLTNFYKCGEETIYPHYGVWKQIDLPSPDFHRPEFFGKLLFHM